MVETVFGVNRPGRITGDAGRGGDRDRVAHHYHRDRHSVAVRLQNPLRETRKRGDGRTSKM